MAWTLKRSLLAGVAVYGLFLALFVWLTQAPRSYASATEFVDVYIVNEYVIGAVLVLLGLLVAYAAVGAVYVVLRTLRIWIVRKRGPGYYKYKDPEKMDASSRNPKEPKTYLLLRPWQWFVVLALTTALTLQVEPIEPFDALPLGVHLGNAYMFAVVIYSLTVLLTIASRSAIETRKRPRKNRE